MRAPGRVSCKVVPLSSLERQISELHGRFAAEVDAVIGARLPEAAAQRFRDFFESLSDAGVFDPSVPAWAMRFYDLEDGLTAAHYHCRNVQDLERQVIDICLAAVAELPGDMPTGTMNFGARRLTYEYQAYLFALRRSFDYLACGVVGRFGAGRSSSFKDIAKALKQPPPAVASYAIGVITRAEAAVGEFPEVLSRGAHLAPRDTVAHYRSLDAGGFTIYLDPGGPPRIALTGGGERLSVWPGADLDMPRLTPLLQDQLRRFELLVFELIALLPPSP
jgi:hypothetical protein